MSSENTDALDNVQVTGNDNDEHQEEQTRSTGTTRENNRMSAVENNPRPNNIRRVTNVIPLCSTDPNNRIPRRFYLISARSMLDEGCKRHHTYCKFMILRINCATSLAGKEDKIDYYSYRNSNRGKNGKVASSFYQRLFLLLDLKDDSGAVYYVVQSGTLHSNMWNFNRSIRDNGDITIGTTVCMLNPKPISNILANDIPMIESDHPFVSLKQDTVLRTTAILDNLPSNDTRAFIIHASTIRLHTFACVQAICSGFFCDRQRVRELNENKKGCGCYYTGRNPSLVFKFDMVVTYHGKRIEITDFTSLLFQDLF